jgi:hypothetical protein
MSMPFASISNLVIDIVVIAVDSGLAHDYLADDQYLPFDGLPTAFRLGFAGSALMANLVIIGGSILVPGRVAERPFLAGFVIAGAASILVVLGSTALTPHDWVYWLSLRVNPRAARLQRWLGPGLSYRSCLDLSYLISFGALNFLSELLIATAGGLVARAFARWREDYKQGEPKGAR